MLGTVRRIGLDRLLPRAAARRQRLAEALIVARVIEPAAKLATARGLDAETASHSLGQHLELGKVGVNDVYATLDWLGARRSPGSRRDWRAATFRVAHWCCTT
ncbi:MAG: hypothetical protein GY798_31855 [Hyphomicrobiales bacterium]|nr:hypothetical protein [Hyphomicrobiales bacterium]